MVDLDALAERSSHGASLLTSTAQGVVVGELFSTTKEHRLDRITWRDPVLHAAGEYRVVRFDLARRGQLVLSRRVSIERLPGRDLLRKERTTDGEPSLHIALSFRRASGDAGREHEAHKKKENGKKKDGGSYVHGEWEQSLFSSEIERAPDSSGVVIEQLPYQNAARKG